jgi:hypothetical protein
MCKCVAVPWPVRCGTSAVELARRAHQAGQGAARPHARVEAARPAKEWHARSEATKKGRAVGSGARAACRHLLSL